MPTDFVIPGANRASAALDLARTVVRRAERLAVARPIEGSLVGPYLNRLSDLLWAMARWTEGDLHLLARTTPGEPGRPGRRGRAGRSVAEERPTGSEEDEAVMNIEAADLDTLPCRPGGRGRAGVPSHETVRRPGRPGTAWSPGPVPTDPRSGLVQAAWFRRQGRPDRSSWRVAPSADRGPVRRAPTSSWSASGDASRSDRRRGAGVAAPGRGRLRPGRGPGGRRPPSCFPRRRDPGSPGDRAGGLGGGRGRGPRLLPLRRLPHRRRARTSWTPWSSSAAVVRRLGPVAAGCGPRGPVGRVGQPGPRPGQRATQLAHPRAASPTSSSDGSPTFAELTVEVWDEDRIVEERLGGLLGVARGSTQPPRLVRVEYQPGRSHRDRRSGAPPGPGGEGDHLRLRRPVAQDGHGHGDHEDRHGRGRRRARRRGCRRRPRGAHPDHRLHPVDREHAGRVGHQAR